MFLQFLRSYRRSIIWSICALHYLNVPTLNHTLLLLGFCWVVCLHDIPPPAFPMSTGCVSHHLVNVGILQIVETPCFSCLLSQEYDPIHLAICIHCTKIQVWCDSMISSWKDWIVGADPCRLESWWSFHTLEANLRRHEKMMKVHLHYLLNLPCSCSVRFQHTCWKRQQFTSTKVWWPLRFFNGAHPVHGTLSLKDILDELQHVR